MSKKPSRRAQKKTRWLFIGLIGSGLMMLAAGLFFAFGGERGGGTPILNVDQEVIDFGEVKYYTTLTFQIKITNTGDGALRFKEKPYIQVLEGC